MIIHTILYVASQKRSTEFYQSLFQMNPTLDVPGMTEFKLSESHILGIMPEKGIKKLLGDKMPDPETGSGIPRVELYIRVPKPEVLFQLAIKLGAVELSEIRPRDWGDHAGYVMDFDGHVLAFANLGGQP